MQLLFFVLVNGSRSPAVVACFSPTTEAWGKVNCNLMAAYLFPVLGATSAQGFLEHKQRREN